MGHQILLVDDDDLVREYLASVLIDNGFQCVHFGSAREALDYLSVSASKIALIFSDVQMPEMTGIEFLARIRSLALDIPVILLSGLYDMPIGLGAFHGGAADYLFKPVTAKDLVATVHKYLRREPSWNEELIRSHIRGFFATTRAPSENASVRLTALLEALETRRFETLQHSQRVAAFSRLIGSRCGLKGKPLNELETGALLHDIGKVAIPQNVIEKAGRLNENEWRLIRLHPSIGASLLSEVPNFEAERSLVLCHHESFDGTGYPAGLAGESIPLSARIFAVADTFDAICSNRPYRRAATMAVARAEIERWSGRHFDPEIVRQFQSITDEELMAVQRQYPEPETLPDLKLPVA